MGFIWYTKIPGVLSGTLAARDEFRFFTYIGGTIINLQGLGILLKALLKKLPSTQRGLEVSGTNLYA